MCHKNCQCLCQVAVNGGINLMIQAPTVSAHDLRSSWPPASRTFVSLTTHDSKTYCRIHHLGHVLSGELFRCYCRNETKWNAVPNVTVHRSSLLCGFNTTIKGQTAKRNMPHTIHQARRPGLQHTSPRGASMVVIQQSSRLTQYKLI